MRAVALVLVGLVVGAVVVVPAGRARPWVYAVYAYPNPADPGDLVTIEAVAEVYNGTGYIAAAEFHIDDTSPTPGTGTAMAAVDGAFDEALENVTGTLDTTNLSAGDHVICVIAEEQDANTSYWGDCGTTILTITGPQPPGAYAGPDQSGLVGE